MNTDGKRWKERSKNTVVGVRRAHRGKLFKKGMNKMKRETRVMRETKLKMEK